MGTQQNIYGNDIYSLCGPLQVSSERGGGCAGVGVGMVEGVVRRVIGRVHE